MTVATVSPISPALQTMDQISINTIRTLSMDAVQPANSGHPGTAMALAPPIAPAPTLGHLYRHGQRGWALFGGL